MAALLRVIAVSTMLLAGISPSPDDGDPTWIGGMYDDADNDGLCSALALDGQLPSGASAPGTPQMTHSAIDGGSTAVAGVGKLPDGRLVGLGIRGPPEVASAFGPADTPHPPETKSPDTRAPESICGNFSQFSDTRERGPPSGAPSLVRRLALRTHADHRVSGP
jgi:hypothetical protein